MLQPSPLIKISSSKFTHLSRTGEGIELALSLRVPKQLLPCCDSSITLLLTEQFFNAKLGASVVVFPRAPLHKSSLLSAQLVVSITHDQDHTCTSGASRHETHCGFWITQVVELIGTPMDQYAPQSHMVQCNVDSASRASQIEVPLSKEISV